MAKKAYIGVEGIARQVKKMYVGVDNVARKIKKAYIGVGGIARPCYTGGEVAYWGEYAILGAHSLAATTIGNYALFGGGSNEIGELLDYLQIFDTSLTYSSKTFPTGQHRHAATTVGVRAYFGGGVGDSGDGFDEAKSNVNIVNNALTVESPTYLQSARQNLAATTVGDYALFGGGSAHSYEIWGMGDVDAISATLTKVIPADFSVGRGKLAATTVGNYALFGGGCRMSGEEGFEVETALNTMDAYDTSLTLTTVTPLSEARQILAATTLGDYAIFAGGCGTMDDAGYATETAAADAYNTSLTRISIPDLSLARAYLAATTIGEFAIFGGGGDGCRYEHDVDNYDAVDVYDTSLTQTVSTPLSESRSQLAAATVGNYALFAGGWSLDGICESSTVDVYTVG